MNPQNGTLFSRIGTVFPRYRCLITIPGTHATQKIDFLRRVNEERQAANDPPLTEEQQDEFFQDAVDLIVDPGTVFIRPNPDAMALAFRADEILQEIVPKQTIKFLHALNPQVRAAIRQRGESWRINALPQTTGDMKRMIRNSKVRIAETGLDLYYYNMETGTRFLTWQQFGRLAHGTPAELAIHLQEIRDFAVRRNRMGNPEIDFFATEGRFGAQAFQGVDFGRMDEPPCRAAFQRLHGEFGSAVAADLHEDNPDYLEWRTRMFATLIGVTDVAVTEEKLLGLGSEFYMQIEWLPSAHVEDGELIFDSLFAQAGNAPCNPELQALCDPRVKGMIVNFVREYGDLEYVNIGRVAGSMSRRSTATGWRGVFVVELKRRSQPKSILRMLRMQKWGIRQHLDDHDNLLNAILKAEEYTDYVLDRRLACRQIGMNILTQVTPHKIGEIYDGLNPEYHGYTIWSTYFERDYLVGIATDKIPFTRYADPAYAAQFARLLGDAAACNIILGRMDLGDRVLFDDGDEVLIEDKACMPLEIVVSDPTGTFRDYDRSLDMTAPAYARPVCRRLGLVPSPSDFKEIYLAAFARKFTEIQGEYRRRPAALDDLFRHHLLDPRGNLAFRWKKVLARLQESAAQHLADGIRRAIDETGNISPE